MVSFNFLVNRLLNFPLTKERYNKELLYIKDIAVYNGFENSIIDRLVNKLRHKKLIAETTHLVPQSCYSKRFVKLPYHRATNKLSNIFKSQDLAIAFKSSNSLKNLLGNAKDKIEVGQKSGIYEIQCNDCNLKYVGQTKRAISTRYKEHMAHLRFNRPEKSSVARHVLETGHKISIDNLKLIKPIDNYKE